MAITFVKECILMRLNELIDMTILINFERCHAIQFKLGVYTYWVSVQNWFAFGPWWPNVGPLVATKWLKMVVSDHYLKKYSHNPSGECSELIRFWVTLAKFWPFSEWPQNYSNSWLEIVIWKTIYAIQFKLGVYTCCVNVRSISNMVFTLVRGVFTNDSIFCRIILI